MESVSDGSFPYCTCSERKHTREGGGDEREKRSRKTVAAITGAESQGLGSRRTEVEQALTSVSRIQFYLTAESQRAFETAPRWWRLLT